MNVIYFFFIKSRLHFEGSKSVSLGGFQTIDNDDDLVVRVFVFDDNLVGRMFVFSQLIFGETF